MAAFCGFVFVMDRPNIAVHDRCRGSSAHCRCLSSREGSRTGRRTKRIPFSLPRWPALANPEALCKLFRRTS
eukprot:1785081-Amphidinium_carterae.1